MSQVGVLLEIPFLDWRGGRGGAEKVINMSSHNGSVGVIGYIT